jgi:Leucine-rich repeat (LRR) protein
MLPTEIGQLINLQSLTLAGNLLTELPPEIGQLSNLRKLDLSSTELLELPPQIGQLTNLIQLDLRDNKLTELPPEIGELSRLKVLRLQDSGLDSPPAEIEPLSDLIWLDIPAKDEYFPVASKLRAANKLGLRELYLAKACSIKLSPEFDRLLKIVEWSFVPYEADCDDMVIQYWQTE